MAFLEREASTSKPRSSQKATQRDKSRIKSNTLRRVKHDDEIKDLRNRIDSFVSLQTLTVEYD